MHCLRRLLLFVPALLLASSAGLAAQIKGAPDRRPDEGEGPFDRSIIRGVYVIDGTGAPPMGPADIVIEGNRIESITVVGTPNVPIDEDGAKSPAGNQRRVVEALATDWHVDEYRIMNIEQGILNGCGCTSRLDIPCSIFDIQ